MRSSFGDFSARPFFDYYYFLLLFEKIGDGLKSFVIISAPLDERIVNSLVKRILIIAGRA
jgi:hypothetical protein